MNTELALLRAIVDFPNDSLPFLAYVDYLKENNRSVEDIKLWEKVIKAFINGDKVRNKDPQWQYWYWVIYNDEIFRVGEEESGIKCYQLLMKITKGQILASGYEYW